MSDLTTLPDVDTPYIDQPPAHDQDDAGYKRVTPEQASHIVGLYELDPRPTQAQIAAAVGVDQSTVSRWLKAYNRDTTEAARKLYQANQLRAAIAVLDKLEDKDGRVVLKAAEIAHKVSKLIDSDQAAKVAVQVVIGMPSTPFAPDDQ